ncbi:hypothetical protein [Parvibaculum sp.]|jgi:hypothetical protein|uniref:hypothetical protein n=1 Tax=Parvibaculum sp. TaxID=2024848 RepID=UPI001B189B2B|nr:hypothetical protein [Parvibaculum sp.]MBO6633512.1 hypothetical protein [Parvibaculum sp.]MBO6680013.1 hypothetical protein [Parvibaculum sp.]MBO6683659.1 hypothetical protein [Parvibaculum sp.]MBO6905343.1 hypothetical protein [Parvibaculum sp.]
MRTFKITVALVLAAFCIGVTGAIYLQSEGAAISVGALIFLVIVSFLYDHRRSIFTSDPARSHLKDDKTATAVAQGAAFTRFAEGEVRGAPNYKGT